MVGRLMERGRGGKERKGLKGRRGRGKERNGERKERWLMGRREKNKIDWIKKKKKR